MRRSYATPYFLLYLIVITMEDQFTSAFEAKNPEASGFLAGGLGPDGPEEPGEKPKVPQTRQRVIIRAKKDKQGRLIIKRTTWFRQEIFRKYKDLAYFRSLNLYDLIADAMEAYYPELKKGQGQKLIEAGQGELALMDTAQEN